MKVKKENKLGKTLIRLRHHPLHHFLSLSYFLFFIVALFPGEPVNEWEIKYGKWSSEWSEGKNYNSKREDLEEEDQGKDERNVIL